MRPLSTNKRQTSNFNGSINPEMCVIIVNATSWGYSDRSGNGKQALPATGGQMANVCSIFWASSNHLLPYSALLSGIPFRLCLQILQFSVTRRQFSVQLVLMGIAPIWIGGHHISLLIHNVQYKRLTLKVSGIDRNQSLSIISGLQHPSTHFMHA